MRWSSPEEAEASWDRMRARDAEIPVMDRAEYLRKYPNGGPEQFTGVLSSDEYAEFRSAIKRRDREGRRGGWIKFWLGLAVLAVVFVVVLLTMGFPYALMTVLLLTLAVCWVEMMMNFR